MSPLLATLIFIGCLILILNWLFFSSELGDRIIRYQNTAERNFQENKSLRHFFPYLLALILFITSTLLAQLRMPYTYWKKWRSRNEPKQIVSIESEAHLQRVLQEEEWVLVDFWAEWCGPCIMMEPALEAFAAQKGNSVRVAKVNANLHPKLLKKLKVRGLPQLVLYRNGQEDKRHAGALTEGELSQFTSKKAAL